MEDNMKDMTSTFTSYEDDNESLIDEVEEPLEEQNEDATSGEVAYENDDEDIAYDEPTYEETETVKDEDNESSPLTNDGAEMTDVQSDDGINDFESLEDMSEEPSLEKSENDDSVDDSSEKKGKKKKKTKKEKKQKKPLSKIQKIFIFIAVGIVIAGIIAASIAIPITIANKDKIFVSEAADFNDTDGKYYVLQNDVHVDGDLRLSTVTNIDFNGKKLIINGNLYIEPEGKADISLGKRTKNGYEKDGYIEAKDVMITSPESTVTLGSELMTESITIEALNVNIIGAVTVREDSTITANSISIDDTFRFSNSEKVVGLDLINAANIVINDDVIGDVRIKNNGVATESGYLTQAKVIGNITGNLYADDKSELIISSHIEGVIDSCVTDSNGIIVKSIGKVKVIGNAVVKEINNASLVYIDEKVVKHSMPELVNVTKFDIIRQLMRVPYINVNDDTDTVIMEFGKVNNADKYIISIDGVEIDPVTDTKVDITNYVKGVKTHLISVKAISESNPELLLPSEEIRYEYKTFLTLSRPYDIKVTNVDSKYILSFSKVSFADEYIIRVNGTNITSSETSVDITDYLSSAGDYIIEITATSRNENIKPSKVSVYQYGITETLASPTLTIQFNQADRTFIFAWEGVDNADVYELVRMNGDVEESVVYRTKGNSIAISMDDIRFNIQSGQRFKIVAKSSSSYYKPSASETVAVPFN